MHTTAPATKQWTCDKCGQPILKVEDGWVEWVRVKSTSDQSSARDLRLVHHKPASPLTSRPSGCQFDEKVEDQKDQGIVGDLPLKEFLGASGLMDLLQLLAEKQLPMEEVLEMIKRLHIPGYERAHRHFEEAIAEGVFEWNTAPGYPHENQIAKVCDWLDRHGRRE